MSYSYSTCNTWRNTVLRSDECFTVHIQYVTDTCTMYDLSPFVSPRNVHISIAVLLGQTYYLSLYVIILITLTWLVLVNTVQSGSFITVTTAPPIRASREILHEDNYRNMLRIDKTLFVARLGVFFFFLFIGQLSISLPSLNPQNQSTLECPPE